MLELIRGISTYFFQFLTESELVGLRVLSKNEKGEIDDEYFRPLCIQFELPIEEGKNPMEIYANSISFYIIETHGGGSCGAIREDVFVLACPEDVLFVLQQDPTTPTGCYTLLDYELKIILKVVQRGHLVEGFEVNLLTFLHSLEMKNGAKLYFDKSCGGLKEAGSAVISKRISRLQTVYALKNEYVCPACKQCTLSCECVSNACELQSRSLIRCSELKENTILSIPKLRGRSIRKNEAFNLGGELYTYGYSDLENGYDFGVNWKDYFSYWPTG